VQTIKIASPINSLLNLSSGSISNTVEKIAIFRVRKTTFASGGYEVDMRRTQSRRKPQEVEERRGRDLQREFERKTALARKEVRQKVKNWGCDRLITLTRISASDEPYWNISHWQDAVARFLATLRRSGYRFQYVAVPQRHQSGHWHVHIAINASVKHSDAYEAWSREAGRRSTVNIRRHIRNDRLTRVAKIGSYITKTIAADWGAFKPQSKHYWSSLISRPKRTCWYIKAPSFNAALSILAGQLGLDPAKILEHEASRVIYPNDAGIFLNFLPILDPTRKRRRAS
jgi:hypothetical protein